MQRREQSSQSSQRMIELNKNKIYDGNITELAESDGNTGSWRSQWREGSGELLVSWVEL